MKCGKVEQIIACRSVDDLFTNNLQICKSEYREYLKLFHPDFHNGERIYQEATSKIVMMYERAKILIESGKWEESNKIRINKPNGKTLIVSYIKEYSFELGKMFLCNRHVVYLIEKKYKKYYDNYISATNFSCSQDIMNMIGYSLPNVVSRFVNDEYCVVIIERKNSCVPLYEVLRNYNGKIPVEHSAWIISRLLGIACFLSYNEIVHNGIDLNSCFLDTEKHGVMLYGGWWYTRPVSEKMIGTSSDVYSVMPLIAKRNKKSKKSTDMECIKMLGIRMLGCASKISDSSVPSQVMSWLRSGSSEFPIEEMKRWESAIVDAFGKRKFIKMNPEMAKINID